MKFINEFRAGFVQSYGPAGTPHEAIQVDSRDIYDLLVFLKQGNAEIDKASSLAIYGDAQIPFGTIFPDNRRPSGYELNGDNLKIELNNWRYNSNSRRNPREPIRIGGSSTRETAVECRLERTLGRAEDKHAVLESFEDICKVVNDFYSSLKTGDSLLLKTLRAQG